jgi:hypothetical protein
MPKNTTGGSGHKSQKNSEGNKAKNNRLKGDAALEDIALEEAEGVVIGRVIRRLGCGRMEVFYVEKKPDMPKYDRLINAALRGGLRGKGKKSVWVDVDSLVVCAETGLSGKTHEILSVLTPEQVAHYRKLCPDADPRLFLKGGSESTDKKEETIEFDDNSDVDVDDI